jgi:tRNA (guanine10-N2)-methyltransferase
VFFLPTVTDEYQEVDIPICTGMEVVANSVQDFGKWARRVRPLLISPHKPDQIPPYQETVWTPLTSVLLLQLITMHKTSNDDFPAPTFEATQRMAELTTAPSNAGHRDFREKYFAKFSVERYKKNIEALYQTS